MSSFRLQRSLVPTDPALIRRAGDPEDLRVGDILTDLAGIPSSASGVVVLLGVPQHIGVERNGGRPGAAGAPSAIRTALSKLAISAIEDVIADQRLVIADLGNIDTEGKTLEQIHDEQHDVVAECLERGYLPIVLGGGHDCAWPTIRALETSARPYGVVNIDAHADVRPLNDGKAHSGSPFRQMLELQPSHCAAGSFVEFGLQSTSVAASHLRYVREAGMCVLMLDEIRRVGLTHAWNDAYANAARPGRLYVSLDMDAFASAYAPGVSAPAADGFTPHDVAYCLAHAARSGHVAVADIVELNPVYDADGRTAKLAATMIMEILRGFAAFLRG